MWSLVLSFVSPCVSKGTSTAILQLRKSCYLLSVTCQQRYIYACTKVYVIHDPWGIWMHKTLVKSKALSILRLVYMYNELQHMRREEKPTRCHWMVYCIYNMVNMFRAHLCPSSSGSRDCMRVITAYGVQCLGCWWSEIRFRTAGYASGWGMLLEQNPPSRTHSLLPFTWPPTTSNQGTAHHRRQ